jgi:hypothetical protein
MSDQKQVVKDQHFVPEFYLRRFTNGDGFIERLVLPTAEVLSRPVSPKAEANDLFFYGEKTGVEDEISQDVEDFWKSVEDFVAPHLDEVEQQIVANQQLSSHDVAIVAHLAAMLWMRTPHFRETLNHNMGNLEKQVRQHHAADPRYTDHLIKIAEKTGKKLTQKKAEELRQFILGGEYNLGYSNVQHLQFMVTNFEGFRNMFYGAKWRFHLISGERQFVTSSAPCIEVFPERRNSFYGPNFYERGHFLPLSPNILAEAINPFSSGKRIKRKRINDNAVLTYNLQQANWSYISDAPQYSRCYASRKQELEELVKWRDQNGGHAVLRMVASRVMRGS